MIMGIRSRALIGVAAALFCLSSVSASDSNKAPMRRLKDTVKGNNNKRRSTDEIIPSGTIASADTTTIISTTLPPGA